MKFSGVLFLVAISTMLAVSDAIKTVVFPTKTCTDYVELNPLKSLNLAAFTLCMRVATELSGYREVILFAYRTTNADELNVWRELDGRLALYLRTSAGSEAVHFQVPQLGALETHLCVTWDSSSGATALFLDGRKSLTKIYKKGHRVQSGGRVILGQDLDSYRGSFDAKQSFVGEISDVNMWDSVLPDSTIQRMSSGKRVPRGNVFDWEATRLEIHGGAKVLNREL
ncbi:pentraxin fusion protein-like [Thunnus albacares]|uniref:pentraxin fusion protein-like n=1 Tax=Thunnus albacares TaxID=8236 RepID=UPI001CF67A3E|nr:pentraxin fusion protein-like [Thunnus albacares]